MSDLIWPAGVAPTQASFGLTTKTAVSQRPFSGVEQRLKRPGEHWRSDLEFARLTDEKAGLLDGLLAALDGQLGTVLVPVFRRQDVLVTILFEGGPFAFDNGFSFDNGYQFQFQTEDGEGLISEPAAVGATQVKIGGFAAAQTVLKPGDHFGLGGDRIYRVAGIAPVVADGSGVATVPIRPGLRAAISAGAPVQFKKPLCRMRLAADSQGNAPTVKPQWSRYRLSLVEDLGL